MKVCTVSISSMCVAARTEQLELQSRNALLYRQIQGLKVHQIWMSVSRVV